MARDLRIAIVGDPSSYKRALDASGKATSKFGSALGRMGKTAALVGGAAGIGGLFITLKHGFDEASQSAQVMAQTNAVLKSTKGVANVSAQAVGDLATKLSQLSGVDDENIQAGENWLLTFKNIRNEAGKGNDIFSQTTKVTLDLAAAQAAAKGTTIDMASASTIMGKALNDPVKGISALTRVGVTFTQAQKDQIAAMVKAGDVLGAQKIILGEVRSQVEGSAKAYGDTFPGQISKLKNAFDEVAGSLLQGVTPALADGAQKLSAFLQKFQNADGAAAKFHVLVQGLQNVATSAFATLKSAFEAINWNAVWAGVKVNAQALADQINVTLANANWNAVGQTIGRVIIAGVNFGQQLGAKLSEQIALAVSNINWQSVFKGLLDGLSGGGGSMFGRFKSFVKNGVQTSILFSAPTALVAGKAVFNAAVNGATAPSIAAQLQAKASAQFTSAFRSAAAASAAAVIPSASASATAIGAAMAQGAAAGLRAQAYALAQAAIGMVYAAIASMQVALQIHSPSKVTADRIGKPMADGIVTGFASAMAARGAEFAAPLQKAALAMIAKIPELKAAMTSAFRQLASDALSAFDARVAAWVPPAQKIIDAFDAAARKQDVTSAFNDALQATFDTRAAYADATQAAGESDADFAARREQLYQQMLDATKAFNDAQEQLVRYNLEQQAADQQKAYDSQAAADREALAKWFAEREKALQAHPALYKKTADDIMKILAKYNVPMYDQGKKWASQFTGGLAAGLAALQAALAAFLNASGVASAVGPASGAAASGSAASRSRASSLSGSGGGDLHVHVHVGTVIGGDLDSAARDLTKPILTQLKKHGKRNGGLAFT